MSEMLVVATSFYPEELREIKGMVTILIVLQLQAEVVGVDEEGKLTGTYTRDETKPRTFTDVTTVAGGNKGNFGSILLGAHINVNGGFGRIDNATLTITGKADNFDYAKVFLHLMAVNIIYQL